MGGNKYDAEVEVTPKQAEAEQVEAESTQNQVPEAPAEEEKN